MDLLRDKVRPLYFRYLAAAFGSTFISSIYSIVDMAVVGQYHGPDGTAALAVVAPVWNVIYSLGLLNGIGGSVWYGLAKGRGSGEENRYFTTALLGAMLCAAAVLAFPNGFVSIFMKPEADVLAIAPAILRTYGLSFLLLPCNVFFTYYFQSVFRPGSALFLSVLRGLALSGGLILILPSLLGEDALWLAMPITEAVTICAALVLMKAARLG